MENATIFDDAAQTYAENLLRSGRAINYLQQRRISGAIASRYGLGFASPDSNTLRPVVRRWGVDACREAALVVKAVARRPYEIFRGRIIFPIRSMRGQLIGFGGRHLEPNEAQPKYLNSPESDIFVKAKLLYGFVEAADDVAAQNRVVVVEGYFDVLRLAQARLPAVATMGTAVTEFHVEQLLATGAAIFFCFDGDDGGRKAADLALLQVLDQADDVDRVNFIFLPAGEDPDSFVRDRGVDAFLELLQAAKPLVTYLRDSLAQGCDLRYAEGRSLYMRKAQQFWAIGSPNVKSILLDACVDVTRLTPEVIEDIWHARNAA